MPMEITIKLSDEDLEHFRSAVRASYNANNELDDSAIINHARELIGEIRQSDAPEYIQERIGSLETLVGLLTDPLWNILPEDRPRVIETLAYFAETNDLIPDEVPGLGFLDDAFMIDIVCRDFKDEIEAYRDFCVHRVTEAHATGRDPLEVDGNEWMEHRRRQLHLRKHLSRKERQA
jgi:uncharacterized membrane protein YkvA (DUF1232 family)